MNARINAPQLSPLYQVVTIGEASRLFFAHEDTIRYHIERGNVIARQVTVKGKGQWLIELYSLIRLYDLIPDTQILGYAMPENELYCGKTASGEPAEMKDF